MNAFWIVILFIFLALFIGLWFGWSLLFSIIGWSIAVIVIAGILTKSSHTYIDR